MRFSFILPSKDVTLVAPMGVNISYWPSIVTYSPLLVAQTNSTTAAAENVAIPARTSAFDMEQQQPSSFHCRGPPGMNPTSMRAAVISLDNTIPLLKATMDTKEGLLQPFTPSKHNEDGY